MMAASTELETDPRLEKRTCRRFKKRYQPEAPASLLQPLRPNQAWAADFMTDALFDGRALRPFNVIDGYDREGLHIEVDVSLTAERITRVLDQIVVVRGRPKRLRVDHGPEFTSGTFAPWCTANSVTLELTQPESLLAVAAPTIDDNENGCRCYYRLETPLIKVNAPLPQGHRLWIDTSVDRTTHGARS